MKARKKLGSGLVALLAHVDPGLRERVRREATAAGISVSEIVTDALLLVLPIVEASRALKDWASAMSEAEKKLLEESRRRATSGSGAPRKEPRHG